MHAYQLVLIVYNRLTKGFIWLSPYKTLVFNDVLICDDVQDIGLITISQFLGRKRSFVLWKFNHFV